MVVERGYEMKKYELEINEEMEKKMADKAENCGFTKEELIVIAIDYYLNKDLYQNISRGIRE